MTATTTPAAPWRSRIVGEGTEDPRALIPNPRNWRLHPKGQQRAVASVLDRVGWVDRVLVNRLTGHLVDGHLRVELAIERHEPSVPVVYVELSDEEEALVLASLDPLTGMAITDADRLSELLAELSIDQDDLEQHLAALLEGKRRAGLVDPDEVPQPPDEPYVEAGQLWRLGHHRLLCGDATREQDVARLLDGAAPRLLVTDPPYGVSLDPTWRDGVYNKLGPAAKPYMSEGHGNRTLSGDTRADWSAAFALVPSLEVAYVWHAGVFAVEVGQGLRDIGFELRAQIIWAKTRFAMSRSAYHWQHEPCWYAVRKGSTARWVGTHDLSTVWELASPKMIMGGSDEDKLDHPTQKPAEAMARPIRKHHGDVYEPFAGSGTTLIGAEQEGRRCHAMEIDPRYAQVVVERWQRFTGETAERVA